MKPLLITALAVVGVALFNLAWDYVPLLPAVLTFGLVVGLPLFALFAVAGKGKR